MTRLKAFCSLFWILATITGAVAAAGEGSTRLFPFPVVEVERVIGRWFTSSGYRTQRNELASGEVSLSAKKDNEDWQIVLKPSSPLFTEVLARCAVSGIPDAARGEALWSLLDRYAKGTRTEGAAADAPIPKAVRQQNEAVICMENSHGSEPIQLTGFVCDESGLALSTAHDLKEHATLTVIAGNGQRYTGRTLRVDYLRDLAVIQTNFRPPVTISLARARLSLKQGEEIFAVGCPQRSSGAVYVGVVDSPPRLANAMPLWQVSLKVLPGSSGSPVFDAEGNLVGVIKGRYRGTDSVGFLIPVSTVKEFLGR
jgi:serine protease Do